MKRQHTYLLASAAALTFGLAAEVRAQTAQLEEITVTARRREESLTDVPLAITAFSDESLEKLNIKDTVGFAVYSPGLQFTDVTAGRQDRGAGRQFIIRGLSGGGQLFLDGAPVAGGEVAVGLDIARVEVLRGPQNVYFGRSTFTGAVNFVTKDIPEEWSGVAQIDLATEATQDYEVSVAGPVFGEKLGLRLTGRFADKNGQWRNAFNPQDRFGDRRTTSVSATIESDLSDDFTAKLYANRYNHDDGQSASVLAVGAEPINGIGLNCRTLSTPGPNNYWCGNLPKGGEQESWINTDWTQAMRDHFYRPQPPSDQELTAGKDWPEHFGFVRRALASHMLLDYTLPNDWSLSTITAYHYDRNSTINDNLATNIATITPSRVRQRLFTFRIVAHGSDFSQEVRLTSAQDTRLRWTFGGNYVKAKNASLTLQATRAAAVTSPTVFAVGRITRNSDTTKGVFGGAYYDITDPLSLSVEARYQSDNRVAIGNTVARVRSEATFKSFSPRVSLDWEISEDATAYVSYAGGVRPGGFNAALVGASQFVLDQIVAQTGLSDSSYDEEELEVYELGLKGAAFDNRVRGAIVGYWGTLSKQQLTARAAYFDDALVTRTFTLTANLGETRIKGLEVEGAFAVNDVFTLSATGAYTSSTVKEYICIACERFVSNNNVAGNSVPGAPKWSGTLAVDATDRLNDNWDWFARADYIYRGAMFIDIINVAKTGQIHIANFRAGVTNDNWKLEGYVTNAFNNRTLTAAFQVNDNARFDAENPTLAGITFKGGLPELRKWGVRARLVF